jgi:two-component system, LytTR family, response regulator
MNVLLVDDEALARRRLRRLLADAGDVTVVAECGSGGAAVEALRTHQVDLVFLDVQMPGIDGFVVAESLQGPEAPLLVFVTAHDTHAVRAFEARALDYLLKPVSAERLRQALERLRPVAAAPAYPARLAVPVGGRIHLVESVEIDHVDAHANYVELHLGSRSLVLRETMTHLESRLDPKRFLRVHRSRIVRLDGIAEAQAHASGRFLLRLKCGARVLTGRSYAARVRDALGLL